MGIADPLGLLHLAIGIFGPGVLAISCCKRQVNQFATWAERNRLLQACNRGLCIRIFKL